MRDGDRMRGVLVAGLLALVCAAGALLPPWVAAHDGEARVLIERADGVQLWFDVELALTAPARRQGLMGREHLAPWRGMWFDFGRASLVTMWMKNTPLPLDMLFVRADGRIAAVHARAEPYSLETIAAPEPVPYVLELAGGSAARLGITRGDRALLAAAVGTRAQRVDGGAKAVE